MTTANRHDSRPARSAVVRVSLALLYAAVRIQKKQPDAASSQRLIELRSWVTDMVRGFASLPSFASFRGKQS